MGMVVMRIAIVGMLAVPMLVSRVAFHLRWRRPFFDMPLLWRRLPVGWSGTSRNGKHQERKQVGFHGFFFPGAAPAAILRLSASSSSSTVAAGRCGRAAGRA